MASMLYNIAFNMLGGDDEARNAVQECYCRILQRWSKVSNSDNPEGYCVRMLQNICRDELRRRKRGVEFAGDVQCRTERNTEDSPESAIVRKEESDMLCKAIRMLPDKYRTVIVLRDIEQKEFSEIEQETGMTPINVRVILSRGRRMLKEIIADVF